MATQYANGKIVTDGLVLCLDAADRNSYVSGSTTWFDVVGSNVSGSLINGPIFNSGSGGSIVFDGVDDCVLFNNSASISPLAFTVNSTVNVKSGTGYARILSKGHYGFTPGYLIQRYPDASGVRFSVGIGSATTTTSTALFAHTTNLYQYNQIYYLSMVSTGTYLYLYINGIKANLTKYLGTGGTVENNTDLNYTAISSSLSVTTLDKLSLGAYSNSSAPQAEYLNGVIFNTQIYNKALSADEVLQNYNAQKSRFGL